MACLCHTRGVDCAQGRQCPVRQHAAGARLAVEADMQLAFNTHIEPWHFPHFSHALNARVLDARQMELVTAGVPLPDLLLKTGAMSGPFRRTRPVTRWTLAARRFTRALLAFLVAPRPYL